MEQARFKLFAVIVVIAGAAFFQSASIAFAVTKAEEDFFDENYSRVSAIHKSADVMDEIFSSTAADQGLPDAPYTRITSWTAEVRRATETILRAIGGSIMTYFKKSVKESAKNWVKRMTSEEFRQLLENENKSLDAAINEVQRLQRELDTDIEILGVNRYPALGTAQRQANELLRLLREKKSAKDAFEKEQYSALPSGADAPFARFLEHVERGLAAAVRLTVNEAARAELLKAARIVSVERKTETVGDMINHLSTSVQSAEAMIATASDPYDFVAKWLRYIWQRLIYESRRLRTQRTERMPYPLPPATPPADRNEFEAPEPAASQQPPLSTIPPVQSAR